MLKMKSGLVEVNDHEYGKIYAHASWHRQEDLEREMEAWGYRKGQYRVITHKVDDKGSPWVPAFVRPEDLL